MSKASEAKCVCGHERIEHQPNGKSPDCGGYRQVLDWPDAEGLWWTDNQDLHPVAIAFKHIDEIRIGSVINTQRRHKQAFGPCKFTRVLEHNPFATQPNSRGVR